MQFSFCEYISHMTLRPSTVPGNSPTHAIHFVRAIKFICVRIRAEAFEIELSVHTFSLPAFTSRGNPWRFAMKINHPDSPDVGMVIRQRSPESANVQRIVLLRQNEANRRLHFVPLGEKDAVSLG